VGGAGTLQAEVKRAAMKCRRTGQLMTTVKHRENGCQCEEKRFGCEVAFATMPGWAATVSPERVKWEISIQRRLALQGRVLVAKSC